jgi:hypothetical protein
MSGSTIDWVSQCTAAALAEHAVPEAVAALLRTELEGTMSDRPMRPNEETALARRLLDAMTPPQTGGTVV